METTKGLAVALKAVDIEKVEERVDRLLATIDSRVFQRHQEQVNVNRATARKHYREVIKYFLAGLEYSGDEYFFTPSHIVDEAWHNFILFTELYGDWCLEQLGQFVHHVPCMKGEVFDQVKVVAGNQILIDVYDVDKKIWTFDSAECGTCGQGQPCGQGSCSCGHK